MVVIRFPDGTDWYKANWAFRQIAEDVIEALPHDEDLKSLMERAEAFGALYLNKIEPAVATKVLRVMMAVANDTLDFKLPGWLKNKPNDHDGQRMYLEALRELVAAIERQAAEHCDLPKTQGASDERTPRCDCDCSRSEPTSRAPTP